MSDHSSSAEKFVFAHEDIFTTVASTLQKTAIFTMWNRNRRNNADGIKGKGKELIGLQFIR